MNKLLFLVLILVLIIYVTPHSFAKVYQVDENTLQWGPGPDPANPPDGRLWYTYNDWTWVEGNLALDSAWPDDPDTYPWPSQLDNSTYCLKIRAPSQISGTSVIPTGYEFDLESAGITGKVISHLLVANAYWNFSKGANSAVAPAFYDEDGKRVFRGDPVSMTTTWWQNVDVDFSNNPTKKVVFVIEPYAAKWVWSGNYMYLEQVTITLIDEADAKCGTKYNPYPLADLSEDCIVDFADVAVIADYWLKCNDPADSRCTE